MMLLLYFLPLLYKVWQRSGACCCYIVYHYCLMFDWSGSCCCWYIVYHYCLRFDSGVIHGVVGYIVYHYCLRFDRWVIHVVVILSIITVYGLSEEWFMLMLLYWLPLLFKVWQRSGSFCCCNIFYHYCLRFDRGVVNVVGILSTITVYGLTEEWVMLLLYCLPLLCMVWERSGSCCDCYNVYHYCLRFDRGVVHVVVILSTINVYGVSEEWFMLLLLYWLPLLFKVWQRSSSCCFSYIVYHYYLRSVRGVVHVVVVILSTIIV
jgi:hypothetical protein